MSHQLPLQVALFTTTKGHWGVKTRYKETVESLHGQAHWSLFERKIAHIKISDGDDELYSSMHLTLQDFGYDVLATDGEWSHGDQTHQSGFIADIFKVFTNKLASSKYTLLQEDDWQLKAYKKGYSVNDLLIESVRLLEDDPDLMQVRFARFNNEFERINRLKAKHNIDAHAVEYLDGFRHSDWSNNPFICRTRDLRAAVILLLKNPHIEQHSEHGIGFFMKYLSRSAEPLFCFSPSIVRALHQGAIPGNEDSPDQPLNSD